MGAGRWTTAILIFAALASFGPAAAAAEPLRVFAAASLTNVLNDLEERRLELASPERKAEVLYSFAGTGVLARQIEHGAPANLFISADDLWMDYAIDQDLVLPESRVVLTRNRLVVVAPLASAATLALTDTSSWFAALDGRALAMADPAYVPAGRYAKQALEANSVWPSVKPKILGTENVRLALVAVERGEANLGVVYATDAAISQKVRTLTEIPTEDHAPITYPMAVVKGHDNESVRLLMAYLTSETAKSVLRAHGFSID